MKWIVALLMGWLGTAIAPVWAEVLDLKYGVNEVDINGDGVKDMIVRVRWDNLNAHSFDKYLVMIRLDGEDYRRGVYEVPKGRDYDYAFRTGEGADCDLAAYKFELDKHHLLKVTQYSKFMTTESFCDATPVTIKTYLLTDGVKEDGMASWGTPPFYLKEIKKVTTKRLYEDAHMAMDGQPFNHDLSDR